MGWKIFQGTIIIAVIFSNIHFRWTDNQYAAFALGLGAAYISTGIVIQLHEWAMQLLDHLYWRLYGPR